MKNRKVVIIGTGFVGMSAAYILIDQKGIDELVLIDVNRDKAEGEAMDLSHGLPYAGTKMRIKAGDYSDCSDAQVIVCTAGAAQKPGQSRLELTEINAKIMKSICENINRSGFNGILVVASNPCDIMTYVAWRSSGLPRERVFGSGTMLDTARLRYMIGEFLGVNYADVQAYIMGEHGDSSFVPWTNTYIGGRAILEELEERNIPLDKLTDIYNDVRDSAYRIIEKKKATYYGIGMSLAKLVITILNNEDNVYALSVYQDGMYGREGLYIGMPAVVGRTGIKQVINLKLTDVDLTKYNKSCDDLEKVIKDIVNPIL